MRSRDFQRLFKELFYRKGFQYDNMFDWTVQNMVRRHDARYIYFLLTWQNTQHLCVF